MSRFSKAAILGLATGIAGLVAGLLPFWIALEEGLDLEILFRMRGKRPAPGEVIVVSIDKESADRFGLPNDLRKWPRSLHADLTDRLVAGGASVIAFDMFFEEPRAGAEDRAFAEAIGRAGNVILCQRMQEATVSLADKGGSPAAGLSIAKTVPPIRPLYQAAAALAPFPLPKTPFKVNRGWTFRTGAGDTPTMPIVAFQLFAMPVYGDFRALLERARRDIPRKPIRESRKNPDAGGIVEAIRETRQVFESDPAIGERMLEELRRPPNVPADAADRRLIASLVRMYQSDVSRWLNFYGPPRTVRTIPYYRFLEEAGRAAGPETVDVSGKAVFVGSSESWLPEQKDGFHTVFSRPGGHDISGVEIAATAFGNLLEDLPVRPLDPRDRIALVFMWGVAIGAYCRLVPPLAAALGATAACILYLAAAGRHFAAAGLWYPMTIPLFFQAPFALAATVLWGYVDSNRERKNIRRAFEHYLPNDVVDRLAKNIADLKASNRMVYGICLVTDAEQYTSLSESMDPKELGTFMNRYYEAVFDPVRRHGGVVSNVIGDSMMAIWVAAMPDQAMKDRSCLAALDIAGAIRRFDPSSRSAPLRTRIGLHAGHIMMGNIGAAGHYEYRPVGDIVNTTARIEGLNKHLGTSVLASDEIALRLDGFLVREVGKFLMVGKSMPVVVHEIICRLADSTEPQRIACRRFAEALEAFRGRRWEEAEKAFLEVASILGTDGPSRFHIDLCELFRKHPPDDSWDGAVRMDKK